MPFNTRLDVAVRMILQAGIPDGRNVSFLEAPGFVRARAMVRFRLPIGSTTDGASTPAILWPGIPPFGPHWLPAAFHDGGYRDYLELWNGTLWVKASLPRVECDELLYEAMGCTRVDEKIKFLIFEGVRLGGEASFRQDRLAA